MVPGKHVVALVAVALTAIDCAPNYIDFPAEQGPVLSPGSGDGAGSTCAGGKPVACYSGPPETAGVGLCKMGARACNAEGVPEGSCVGEVTPRPENCATPVDEDCDGLAPACTGKVLWSKQFGDGDEQISQAVATDGAGNVYIAGFFRGAVDFGGGPLVTQDKGDAFVAKLDAGGNYLWSKRFGGASVQLADELAVGADGGVIVIGSFSKEIDFGNGPEVAQSGEELYVVKLDANGNYLWDRHFGGNGSAYASSVSVDMAGNVIATGCFDGSVDFGDGLLQSQGDTDLFLIKLNEAGSVLWSKGFGDPSSQCGESVAVDPSDNILVTGQFSGTIDLGGGPLSSHPEGDIFVLKMDPYGSYLWGMDLGGSGYLSSSRVSADRTGNVIVAGDFTGTAHLGGAVVTANTASGDVFLMKLDADGGYVWDRRFGGANRQYLANMTTDDVGNIVFTGWFDGELDFGGGPLASMGHIKTADIFLVKLDASAGHLWSKRFGESDMQIVRDIATDRAGDVLLTGAFYSSLNFGTGTLSSVLPNGGSNENIFVAAFAP